MYTSSVKTIMTLLARHVVLVLFQEHSHLIQGSEHSFFNFRIVLQCLLALLLCSLMTALINMLHMRMQGNCK